jgi:membrane protein
MIGKFGIGFTWEVPLATVYGAAGSVVSIILIWVYYSAIILYFGAEFTSVC